MARFHRESPSGTNVDSLLHFTTPSHPPKKVAAPVGNSIAVSNGAVARISRESSNASVVLASGSLVHPEIFVDLIHTIRVKIITCNVQKFLGGSPDLPSSPADRF
jgi:hypothetical protein